jgi:hypothetical protein
MCTTISSVYSVRAGLRRPERDLNRDNLVMINQAPHHLDAAITVAWAGRTVVLCDEDGREWTLRRFAPYRPSPFASHLLMNSLVVTVFGYVDIGGIKVEYSAEVDLSRGTARLAV